MNCEHNDDGMQPQTMQRGRRMGLLIGYRWMKLSFSDHNHRGSLHSQVEYHMRNKFATPILYGIDNFENNEIFNTYT
jgi:hypothetical protein